MHSLDVGWLADCSWIGLRAVLIGKTPNQIPKIRGSTIALEVRCNFSGGGGTPDPLGYPPQAPFPSVTSVPRSMPCFRCIQRLDPFQFVPNFDYLYIIMPSVLKMYRVVLTVVVGIASVGTESVGIVSASRLILQCPPLPLRHGTCRLNVHTWHFFRSVVVFSCAFSVAPVFVLSAGP